MTVTTEWLLPTLERLAGTPSLLFATVFILTFVLEDAVAVAAGVLAGRMAVDPFVAVAALVAGTVAGDMALHAAGRWLADTRLVLRLRSAGSGRVEASLRSRGIPLIALARFIPGTRLPVFLGSGIVRVSLLPTTLVIVGTTLLWTPGLFWLSYGAGEHVFSMITPATLVLGTALTAGVLLLPRIRRALASHAAAFRAAWA